MPTCMGHGQVPDKVILDFPSLGHVILHSLTLTSSKHTVVIIPSLFSEVHGEYSHYCIRGQGMKFTAHNDHG